MFKRYVQGDSMIYIKFSFDYLKSFLAMYDSVEFRIRFRRVKNIHFDRFVVFRTS